MASENWCRNEPEVGAVARVAYLNKEYLCECVIGDNSRKCWTNRTGFVVEWDLPFHWVFVTTHEEQRLRAEVERLEGKLLTLRNSIINAPIVLNTSGMIHRWSNDLVKMLDKKTEAGGGGMSVPTILDEGPPDDWNGQTRECDICRKVGNCTFTDDPVFQNEDDEWWCFPCWAKRAMQGEGTPREKEGGGGA